MDLVRAFFRALNAADLGAIAACYDPGCIAEHVFAEDDGVYEGRDVVVARWASELETCEGALAGGHRYEVPRIASLETGWGWVRVEWTRALRSRVTGVVASSSGYSHFWIENARIRRHRSVIGAKTAPGVAPNGRRYPTRPIVGVGAVVLADDGRVLLVKRTQEPLAGQWSLPGGTLEIGETLEAGAAREILEETGLVVDVGPVVEVFDRILVDDTGQVRYHFVLIDYLCRPRGGVLHAGSDVSDVVWADPKELSAHRVTDKVRVVVARACGLADAPAMTPRAGIDFHPTAR